MFANIFAIIFENNREKKKKDEWGQSDGSDGRGGSYLIRREERPGDGFWDRKAQGGKGKRGGRLLRGCRAGCGEVEEHFGTGEDFAGI